MSVDTGGRPGTSTELELFRLNADVGHAQFPTRCNQFTTTLRNNVQ
ncbi:hypothetical protein ACFQKD_16275 [Halobaculum marinum]|uniref:Uncharacterized protein n=1 Tax=Halobaculum marinum TaxID=3031996 RepID=A0ABD5X5K1_9EURY